MCTFKLFLFIISNAYLLTGVIWPYADICAILCFSIAWSLSYLVLRFKWSEVHHRIRLTALFIVALATSVPHPLNLLIATAVLVGITHTLVTLLVILLTSDYYTTNYRIIGSTHNWLDSFAYKWYSVPRSSGYHTLAPSDYRINNLTTRNTTSYRFRTFQFRHLNYLSLPPSIWVVLHRRTHFIGLVLVIFSIGFDLINFTTTIYI